MTWVCLEGQGLQGGRGCERRPLSLVSLLSLAPGSPPLDLAVDTWCESSLLRWPGLQKGLSACGTALCPGSEEGLADPCGPSTPLSAGTFFKVCLCIGGSLPGL